MAHVFVLAEARPLWMNLMLHDLEHRWYPHRTKQGSTSVCQCNPREVKLFNFSLPEDCIPMLLDDLAPYTDDKSFMQGRAALAAKSLRALMGLKPIRYNPISSCQIHKTFVNILPIGWKIDKIDTMHLDRGELL